MKVRFNNQINYNVKIKSPKKLKVVPEKSMPSNYFHELYDVKIDNIDRDSGDTNQNNFVVMYNSALNKFELVDPDQVLVAAASTTGASAPGRDGSGLPAEFFTSVENEIQLDGGEF